MGSIQVGVMVSEDGSRMYVCAMLDFVTLDMSASNLADGLKTAVKKAEELKKDMETRGN